MAVIAFCKNCNQKFTPCRSSKGLFCSHSCYWRNMLNKSHGHRTMNGKRAWNKGLRGLKNPSKGLPRLQVRGENAWNWKGGLKGKNYLERRKFQSTIQKQVFERDDYTCQICGIRGVDLQVDHIQSWADYVELRFSIDNCRTLCAKCHYEITFGRPMPSNIKGWGHNFLKVRVAQ